MIRAEQTLFAASPDNSKLNEDSLEEDAGERQRAASQQPEQCPRQPQLHQDRPVRVLMRAHARDAQREWADERQQQRCRDEEHRERTDRARRVPRQAVHAYDTHARPDAVVVSVSRGENNESQSVDRIASATDASRATRPSASTIKRVA